MGVKVMVVDDEKEVENLFRLQFRRELRSGKISFLFAFSGEEALKKLTSQEAANLVLILSDINMPGMSGLELLKHIKESHNHLKVYMITAYGDEKNRRIAEKYGADDFITKPVNFMELKDRILST